jgi:hypothetical protein
MGAWGKRTLGRMHERNRKNIMEVSRSNDGREQKVGKLAQLPSSRFLTLSHSHCFAPFPLRSCVHQRVKGPNIQDLLNITPFAQGGEKPCPLPFDP